MIRKKISKIFMSSVHNNVNIVKTLLINFVLLPFSQAIHFPILIYGGCKFGNLSGTIEFLSPIKKGMLKIGVSDPARSIHSKSYICLCGVIRMGQSIELRRGISLNVVQNSILTLNDNVFIADNGSICVTHKVTLGRNTRVGNNVTFMDTDYHYIINRETHEVKKNIGTIEIGESNWIGGWCTIKKNTKTPNYMIVAGPYSMLSKDYTTKIAEYSFIGGVPAKLISEGFRRVNNCESDKIIDEHYKMTDKVFVWEGDIDSFCVPPTFL